MEELIKTNVFAYAYTAAFVGLLCLLIIYGVFKKTKNLENRKVKNLLRFGISCVLVCLWTWCFIFVNLYPISLAYHEYTHTLTEEKHGVIENIEYEGKDRIIIFIDNAEYTMVHSSVKPAVMIGRDIDEGDTVTFVFGEKSKFIFDIYKSNTNP